MVDVVSLLRTMPRKKEAGGAQSHPEGPLETVDDTWKAVMRVQMAVKGWTQQDLSDQTGASTGTISNVFKPGPRQTRYRLVIEEALGVKNGARKTAALESIRLDALSVSNKDLKLAAAFVKTLAKKTQSG